jgi:hypothetical protein
MRNHGKGGNDMKEFDYEKIMTVRVKKATCDDCGSDCTNSYFDLLIRPSFCERSDFIKTICWKCYEKLKKESEKNATKK